MMTLKDKALIAFHHIANGEGEKVEAIQSTIGMKDYTCIDFDFTSPLSCAIVFSSVWGVEYWKNSAIKTASDNRYLVDKLVGAEIPSLEALAAEQLLFEGRAMAIDEALLSICQIYGFYPDDVRKLVGAAKHERINPEAKPDEMYLATLVDSYKAMLESWPGNALQKSNDGACVH